MSWPIPFVKTLRKKVWFVHHNYVRKGLFTVAAIDNIGHNPPSNTAKCSFHGNGMFLKVYYEYVHPYEYQLFLQILFSTIVCQYFLYLSQYLFYLSSLFGLL